jgi:hypothetical protein
MDPPLERLVGSCQRPQVLCEVLGLTLGRLEVTPCPRDLITALVELPLETLYFCGVALAPRLKRVQTPLQFFHLLLQSPFFLLVGLQGALGGSEGLRLFWACGRVGGESVAVGGYGAENGRRV